MRIALEGGSPGAITGATNCYRPRATMGAAGNSLVRRVRNLYCSIVAAARSPSTRSTRPTPTNFSGHVPLSNAGQFTETSIRCPEARGVWVRNSKPRLLKSTVRPVPASGPFPLRLRVLNASSKSSRNRFGPRRSSMDPARLSSAKTLSSRLSGVNYFFRYFYGNCRRTRDTCVVWK
jgi:hypothetical protein